MSLDKAYPIQKIKEYEMTSPIESNNSRERFVATLNHKQPDRIPIDFGGTSVTGMHVSCVAALRDHYGL